MPSVPALDGVRALAAFLVVGTHVGFQSGMSGHGVIGALAARGDVGVAIFFVLSGFLLTRAWISVRPPALRGYALTRAARILPAYWVALAGVLLLGSSEPSASVVAVNTAILQGYTLDFLPGFTQTWSLTTEVAFYLALPLLVLPLRRTAWRLWWVAALGVAGLVCTGIAAAGPHPALGLSILGHLDWFAGGLAVAVIERHLRDGDAPAWAVTATRWVRDESPTLLAATGVLLLVAATPLAGPRDLAAVGVPGAVVKEALYLVIATALVSTAVWGARSAWPSRALGSRTGRWLGSVSYGVFLWHLLILERVAGALGIPLFGGHALFLLGTVSIVSVGVAWASLHVVEDPIRRVARKASGRTSQRGNARELVQPVGTD